jgi:hypothetical protein
MLKKKTLMPARSILLKKIACADISVHPASNRLVTFDTNSDVDLQQKLQTITCKGIS